MGKQSNKVMNFIQKNDTNILTGIGIANGLVIGGYLWYMTGVKCNRILTNEEQKKGSKLTAKEKVKCVWKMFLLPCANTAISGGLLIYSARIGNKRLAALGAAYNLTEVAFQKYIDKTKDELSAKKVDEVNKEIAEESIEKAPASVLIAGNKDSEVKFYEPLTDRYFTSTWNKIQKAANELNAEALNSFDGKISLSDWFYKLGIPKTNISDELGWDAQDNGKNGIIDISMDAVLDSENIPCGSIRYNTRPRYFK